MDPRDVGAGEAYFDRNFGGGGSNLDAGVGLNVECPMSDMRRNGGIEVFGECEFMLDCFLFRLWEG